MTNNGGSGSRGCGGGSSISRRRGLNESRPNSQDIDVDVFCSEGIVVRCATAAHESPKICSPSSADLRRGSGQQLRCLDDLKSWTRS